jgi:hypothetical protein
MSEVTANGSVGDPSRDDLDSVARLGDDTSHRLELRWLRGGRPAVRSTATRRVVSSRYQ